MYRSYHPAQPLADLIDTMWLMEEYAPGHAFERVLPDGATQIILNLRDGELRIYGQQPDEVQTFRGPLICGPRSRFTVIDTAQQASIIGAHFRPGGLSALLATPVDPLRDAFVPLEVCSGAAARELHERLLSAPTPTTKLEALEAALSAMWTGETDKQHPAVAFALAQFRADPCMPTIAAVAEQTGLSQHRFIQVFAEAVGLTPKTYCRVLRFQMALRAADRGARLRWAEVAAACGYYDQAHFIHDFRAFSGLTPSLYGAKRREHLNHVPLDR